MCIVSDGDSEAHGSDRVVFEGRLRRAGCLKSSTFGVCLFHIPIWYYKEATVRCFIDDGDENDDDDNDDSRILRPTSMY